MTDNIFSYRKNTKFDYEKAFSRNLGWLNKDEQSRIKKTVVAIPGLGGTGGLHLHALLRAGFEQFKIADFDDFDLQDFNRQVGASMETLGQTKTKVIKDLALTINPNANIECFSEGITDSNVERFLTGVDIVADGLGLFEIDIRIKLYEHAHDTGIPVVTAAALGMGTSVLCFHPKGMSFNSYFNLFYNLEANEKMARFLCGLAPKAIHEQYMYYKDYINLERKRVPSLHMGCLSATSALSSVCLKIVLGRGQVIWAPRGFQIDFYCNQYKKFWRPFGNRNWLQRRQIASTRKLLDKLNSG